MKFGIVVCLCAVMSWMPIICLKVETFAGVETTKSDWSTAFAVWGILTFIGLVALVAFLTENWFPNNTK